MRSALRLALTAASLTLLVLAGAASTAGMLLAQLADRGRT